MSDLITYSALSILLAGQLRRRIVVGLTGMGGGARPPRR